MVAGRSQTQFPGLIQGSFHDVRTIAKELDPHGSASGDLPYPVPSLIGGRKGFVTLGAEEEVGVDSRRGDLVGHALGLLIQGPIQAVATAGVPDGGDAVAEPQLEDVLGRRSLLLASHVSVHVDKARQDIHPFHVELVVI